MKKEMRLPVDICSEIYHELRLKKAKGEGNLHVDFPIKVEKSYRDEDGKWEKLPSVTGSFCVTAAGSRLEGFIEFEGEFTPQGTRKMERKQLTDLASGEFSVKELRGKVDTALRDRLGTIVAISSTLLFPFVSILAGGVAIATTAENVYQVLMEPEDRDTRFEVEVAEQACGIMVALVAAASHTTDEPIEETVPGTS